MITMDEELITQESIDNRAAFTLADLTARMAECHGDEEAMALWADAVESAGEEFRDYIQSIMDARDAIASTVDGLTAQIKRLQELKASRESYVARVDASVLAWLQMNGLQNIVLPHHTLKVRTNPPSVQVTDEALIPEAYWRVKEVKSVDKVTLKEDLKSGAIVDGCALVQTQRLEIK